MAGQNFRKKFGAGEADMSSTLAIAAMGALALGSSVSDSPAQAAISPQERAGLAQSYRIASGPLPGALNAFADLNGLQILYDSEVTSRLRTVGLDGDFAVDEGLDRLLSGTGLSWRFAAKGKTVSIILAQNDRGTATDASSAAALPPIDVGAEAKERTRGAPQGPGDRFTGYRPSPTAATTLKTDTPIMQTPISVQVVTRQTMDDQQAISMRDAIVSNVSGVTLSPNFFDILKIRGFSSFGSTFKNGLQDYRARNYDTTNLQSIDVLKGPAAMLFGRMEPGGVIDMVLKRPLETPYYSVEEQLGSYGLTRTTIDATGPITSDKSILYRVNGEYYRTDSYRDYVTDRAVFIAPTVSFHPIEQFRMNVDFEYQNKTWVDDYPIYPAVAGGPANLPRSRYLSPAFLTVNMPNNISKRRIAYDWTYDLSPDWSVTNRLSYALTNNRTDNGFPLGFNQATGVLTRSMTLNLGYVDKVFSTNLDVKGKFATGPLQHSILVGFDHFDFFSPMSVGASLSASAINVYAPNSWQFENILGASQYTIQGQKWTGVYAQDMISFLGDSVHVLLGGRYDWAETAISRYRTSPYLAASTYWASYDKGFSPRLGVVYQPFSWLSLYGNFTQALGANQVTTQGVTLSPQRGEQYEGGLKAEFFDKGLLLTMAYFDITKTNVPVTDPSNANNTLLIGKARSQGFEIDLTGRIDDNWSVIANYTHDDVRTLVGTATDPVSAYTRQVAVSGGILPGSPRNYGNLWVKYDADGDLRGLSVAGGVSASSDQLGDTANSFVLPSYSIFNGMIAYRTKIEGFNVTAQLNVKNIGDRTYYPSAASRYLIQTGTPRTFMGSLRVEF
ncbi:TonB-dependent receptor [Methylosinus sp. R-45379]|uniref:TonB-dependent siderophore receptor n=1 Tax=Methylosinus sp. R-45379 TaxID=980563 RepID=UPI000B04275B|nr:TonB-dependent receptor [Methylosinus sp. R-45379]